MSNEKDTLKVEGLGTLFETHGSLPEEEGNSIVFVMCIPFHLTGNIHTISYDFKVSNV